MIDGKERLTVSHRDNGVVEWRVVRPLFGWQDILPCSILGGMATFLLHNRGLSWEQAAALGAAAAAGVLLLQGLVEVSAETLVLDPAQGVRLEAQRRCRAAGQSRLVPLGRLDGDAMVHVHTTSRRKVPYLAITLRPRGGSASHSGDDSDRTTEAELAFPNLSPPPALIHKILEELQPTLKAAVSGSGGKAPERKKQK